MKPKGKCKYEEIDDTPGLYPWCDLNKTSCPGYYETCEDYEEEEEE